MNPAKPAWRNWCATVGATQFSWGLLDKQGLKDYPDANWPYQLDPTANWIAAAVFIAAGLACLEKRASASRACALGLAAGVGWRFYNQRAPANPYKDYGEDHFAYSLLFVIGVFAAMAVVIFVEAAWRRSQAVKTSTAREAANQP
jgi:hypothetical protein